MERIINIKMLDQQLDLIDTFQFDSHNKIQEIQDQIFQTFTNLLENLENSQDFNRLLQRLKEQLKQLEFSDSTKTPEILIDLLK